MQGVLAVRNYRRKMREEIRIQTVIATRRIDDRNSKGGKCEGEIKRKRECDKKRKMEKKRGSKQRRERGV